MLTQDRYKKYMTTALIVIALGIISFVILLESPLNPLCTGAAGRDSSVFKYVAEVMSEGGMPYRDTFDHKGPLIYILNWLGSLISSYRGVWCIEFLFLFLLLFVLFRTARLFCGNGVSLFLVIVCVTPLYTFFEGGNLIEEYAMLFTAVAVYIYTDYFINGKITKTRLVVCGFCFGAVCMLRLNMVAVWVVFSIAVLVKCILEKKNDWIFFLLWFLAGMAVIVLPLCIWLAVSGSFSDFINDYIIFNVIYTTDETATVFSRLEALSLFLLNGIVLASMIILIYLLVRLPQDRFFHIACLVCDIVSLATTVMAGRAYGHYGMILIPLLVYPFARLYSISAKEPVSRKVVFNLLVVILIFVPVMGFAQNAGTQVQHVLDHKSTTISKDQRKVVNLITENTTEDDQIIVLGNRDIYYLLSHRMAASKYSYQTTISELNEDMFAEFLEDMETNCPPVVVMVGDYEDFFPNAEDYDTVYSFDRKDETTTVYVRRAAHE